MVDTERMQALYRDFEEAVEAERAFLEDRGGLERRHEPDVQAEFSDLHGRVEACIAALQGELRRVQRAELREDEAS